MEDRIVADGTFRQTCRLEGGVDARLEGDVYAIRIRLAGSPCRCGCESRVSARSPPPPAGEYDVRIEISGDHPEATGPPPQGSTRVTVR